VKQQEQHELKLLNNCTNTAVQSKMATLPKVLAGQDAQHAATRKTTRAFVSSLMYESLFKGE
jgi:hypothetical protein